jgi:hypothetical protein
MVLTKCECAAPFFPEESEIIQGYRPCHFLDYIGCVKTVLLVIKKNI